MNDAVRVADLEHAVASQAPATIEVFAARCEARAMLWAHFQLDMHMAVDPLQEHAVASGLVAAIGQDAVQRVMSDAFASWRQS